MENQVTIDITNNLFTINNLWMMLATALVFIMHLGFATLEVAPNKMTEFIVPNYHLWTNKQRYRDNSCTCMDPMVLDIRVQVGV